MYFDISNESGRLVRIHPAKRKNFILHLNSETDIARK